MSSDTDADRLKRTMKVLRMGITGICTEDDVEWIEAQMDELAGTRDLEEANRRMDVVNEWRMEAREHE